MSPLPPFHLAFPVHDLAAARAFYGGLLGCPEGRSADEWIDFDFFGHQIVAHSAPDATPRRHSNAVDGHDVPVPHFGVVLRMARLGGAGRAARGARHEFVIEPDVRFAGEPASRRRCSSSTRRATRSRSRRCAIRPICSRNRLYFRFRSPPAPPNLPSR